MPLTIAASTPLAGVASGGLLGRAGKGTRSRLAKAGLVVGMAFVATVVGALPLAMVLGISDALINHAGPLEFLPRVIAVAVTYGAIGVVSFGPLFAPLTLSASAIWAFRMAKLSPAS